MLSPFKDHIFSLLTCYSQALLFHSFSLILFVVHTVLIAQPCGSCTKLDVEREPRLNIGEKENMVVMGVIWDYNYNM